MGDATQHLNARRFVNGMEGLEVTLRGERLIPPQSLLTGLEEGVPYVVSYAVTQIERGEEDQEVTLCRIRARGIIWTEQYGLAERLFPFIQNPAEHPHWSFGVTTSKDVSELPVRGEGERFRVHNYQTGPEIEYFTSIVARSVERGFTVATKKLNSYWYQTYAGFLRDDKDEGQLRRFDAGMQVYSIANGTVAFSDVSTTIEKPFLFDCETVADGNNVAGSFFIPVDQKRSAVRQTLELRLRQQYQILTTGKPDPALFE